MPSLKQRLGRIDTSAVKLPRRLSGRKAAASGGARRGAGADGAGRWQDRELRAQRDRLVEKFTIMQADLGGAFYEMAIRDHVKLDALTRKAAELQKVDRELGEIEQKLARSAEPGVCPSCDAPHDAGVKFCPECGRALTRPQPA
jgi:hypothetical protein